MLGILSEATNSTEAPLRELMGSHPPLFALPPLADTKVPVPIPPRPAKHSSAMTSITAQSLLSNPLANYPQATVACFDPTTGDLPRRRLDDYLCVSFLERLSGAGAAALLIAASTGHGHLRTTKEMMQWTRVAAKAKLGSTMLSLLLRPEDGEAANRELVAAAAELGYSVVFVRPGRDLPATAGDEQVAANMQPLVRLIAEAGLAAGLYTIPDVSGLPMSTAAAEQVCAGIGGDSVVAIKVTEANYDTSTARFLASNKLAHLKIVQGWDPHMARALEEGGKRVGVTSGPMSFAVYQYLHMFAAASRGDYSELHASQQAVSALFSAMQDDPRKFADLQRAKWIMGLGQPLTGTVEPATASRVIAALESLPRTADRQRLSRSLDLMQTGPYHDLLSRLSQPTAA